MYWDEHIVIQGTACWCCECAERLAILAVLWDLIWQRGVPSFLSRSLLLQLFIISVDNYRSFACFLIHSPFMHTCIGTYMVFICVCRSVHCRCVHICALVRPEANIAGVLLLFMFHWTWSLPVWLDRQSLCSFRILLSLSPQNWDSGYILLAFPWVCGVWTPVLMLA